MTNDQHTSRPATIIEPDGTPQDEPSPAPAPAPASDTLTILPADEYHSTPETHKLEPEHRVTNFTHERKGPLDQHNLGNVEVNINSLPYFVDFVKLYNFPNETPAHALMFYALQLGYALENNDITNAELAQTSNLNPKGMLTGICMLYNVEPEAVTRYWPEVDRMLATLNLTQIPTTPAYRHVRIDQRRIAAAVQALAGEKVNKKL